ncbi:MAG: pro-sigmaK processing inhibitor BofA family protein [Bacilli bacterium]|nr:pro-sigmaK processing inhibitor BofA family protein [Bacilli bacterium]
MIKKLFLIIKKVTISFFLLYTFNIIIQPLNFIIPINYITVLSISFLGIPALLSLITLSIFIF